MNDWIKQLRTELGRNAGLKKIPQGALAEMVGVGLSAVGRWEMKKRPQEPELDSYLKLFNLASPELRAKAPRLVGDHPNGHKHAPDHPLDGAPSVGKSAHMLNPQEAALVEYYRAMSPDDQHELYGIAKQKAAKRASTSQPPAALKSKA